MYQVLDKGFIEVKDKLGTDCTIINAAKVSFGKEIKELSDKDIKLLKYLKTNKHYSPFRHVSVQFHIKAPETILRQWYKHIVGIETTSTSVVKDHAWNEISRRYIDIDEFYFPSLWRIQSESNKQGSVLLEDGTPVIIDEVQEQANNIYSSCLNVIKDSMNKLSELQIAREQYQMLLPISFYSEIYWTASFQAIMNFIELRNDLHAQWEIQQYAKVIKNIMLELYPISTDIWLNN